MLDGWIVDSGRVGERVDDDVYGRYGSNGLFLATRVLDWNKFFLKIY